MIMKDRRRRPEGSEWEQIKIPQGNLACPKSDPMQSRPCSYWKATSPQNRVRTLESKRKHNQLQERHGCNYGKQKLNQQSFSQSHGYFIEYFAGVIEKPSQKLGENKENLSL
jgi:hypothetical protein